MRWCLWKELLRQNKYHIAQDAACGLSQEEDTCLRMIVAYGGLQELAVTFRGSDNEECSIMQPSKDPNTESKVF